MNAATHKKALNAYGRNSLDTAVESASPHRLIVMLYDGAIKAVSLAQIHMGNGAIAEKGAAISKAIAIIEEGLRLALDLEKGGELAENLDALYEYMTQRLLEANLNNRSDLLDEVGSLLLDLKTAWDVIDPALSGLPDAVEPEQRAAPLSYGKA
jgi:flagellar secretion chaperone FliS